jgi:hypothetical protein
MSATTWILIITAGFLSGILVGRRIKRWLKHHREAELKAHAAHLTRVSQMDIDRDAIWNRAIQTRRDEFVAEAQRWKGM